MRRTLVIAICLTATSAHAIDFEWGEAQFHWRNKFTLGAGLRTEERDSELIGKLNVPGQQRLCQPDICLALDGNPEPTERLKNAAGGFFQHNGDDGNMNYDKGDFYTLLGKLNTDLTVDWGEWTFKASMINFFDQANADFATRHFNTLWQPEYTPRLGEVEHRIGVRGEFRELFAATVFPIEFIERDLSFAVGWQRLRWGEANLHLLNTLDVINPQDAVLARQPGLNLNELNVPTNLVVIGTDLIENVSADVWYQLEWEPVRPEPAGSFFSSSDVAGGGNYAILALGQVPEDPPGPPDFAPEPDSEAGLISSLNARAPARELSAGDFGQFGIRVNWLSDFNDGTEFGFYAANYHSRLPYLSVLAMDRTCLRDAAAPNIVAAFIACDGFNGSINDQLGLPPGQEPFPFHTATLLLDYPEDIRMYGISFNTTLFGWSWSGEYSYRPNVPIQIQLPDVVQAATQPALPDEDIPLNGTGLSCVDAPGPLQAGCQLLLAQSPLPAQGIIPGRRTFVPDFITRYRGMADVAPNQFIPGYERVQMSQFALNALKLFPSSNPFDADSILLVLEGGFTWVHNMPEGLYFQGNGDQTHPSPGADCTGFPAGHDCRAAATTARINPTQQTEGFADEFSWGARMLLQFTYENAWDLGVNIKPSLLWFEDIKGIAPFPQQNYVEDNQFLVLGPFLEIGQDWAGTLLYQWHRGDRNPLRDRDNISMSLSYSF